MISVFIIFLIVSEAILQGLSPLKLGVVLLDYVSLPALLFRRIRRPELFKTELSGWCSYRRRSILGRTLKVLS